MPSSTTQRPLPKAILFDHDGVLVNSEPLHAQAWSALLAELALPPAHALIHALIGTTAPLILASILDEHRPGWDPAQYDLHALARRKNDVYLRLAEKGLHTFPGVPEGLAWLKSKGVKTAVVSNAKRRELETALRHLGIYELFDTVISRDDAGVAKPDPTAYLMAAASLDAEVGECMAVEDSPAGIEAALLARVPAVAVLSNFPLAVMQAPVPGRPDLKPALVVERIAEFFDYLSSPKKSRV
jgi:beta-phosphoglucomutase